LHSTNASYLKLPSRSGLPGATVIEADISKERLDSECAF
jgi:hypothetical protein